MKRIINSWQCAGGSRQVQIKSLWRQHCILLTAYCLLLASCTERMDITTGNAAPQLVITGYITTDTLAHRIQISRTVGYFGTEKPKTYSDAVVKINNEDLNPVGEGLYLTDSAFFGVSGKTYKLDVWVDFDEDGIPEYYTASTTMPRLHVLDSLTLSYLENADKEQAWWPWVHFQNSQGVNYFGAHLYIRDTLYSNKLQRYFLSSFDNSAIDGQYIHFPVFSYLLEGEMRWDGDTHFKVYAGDKITIELNTLSTEYYEYIRAAKREISGSNPLFAGPPANVPGNISGGALGIFGSYTISRKSTWLPML